MKRFLSIVLVLITCFALFACENEPDTPTTTSSVAATDNAESTTVDTTTTTIADNEDASTTTIEATTQATTSTTTTTKTTTTTAKKETTSTTASAPAGQMTKEKAAEIASDLIERYSTKDFFSSVCDLSFDDVTAEEEAAVRQMIQDEVMAAHSPIYKSTCCHTKAEAVNHTKRVLAGEEYTSTGYSAVEYNGSVFFPQHLQGGSYDWLEEIISFSDDRIVARAINDGEGGTYWNIYTIENFAGTYKIVSVEGAD